MREVKLPSGAFLRINPAPFADSKNLYQSLLKELRNVQIDSKMEMANLYKELFCISMSSPEIESSLWKCLERCLYVDKGNVHKIVHDTFEPISAREDYMSVCIEVAKENVEPFTKSLFVEFRQLSEMIENLQK